MDWKFCSGYCNICGNSTRFFYEKTELFREQLSCEHCRATSRYRSIARGLLDAIKQITGVSVQSLADLPHSGVEHFLRIYDTQPPFTYNICAYPLAEFLKRYDWIDLHLSSYKPNLQHGSILSPGVTNQNLECLTFPDGYFDIVITSDVMEHVRRDKIAHAEIARVLSSGGVYLFTVPHNWQWDRTLIRVAVVDDASPDADVFLLEPEYHGDANSDDGSGVLAYRAYGRDLIDDLEMIGLTLNYESNNFPELGIFNTELFYCKWR